MKKDNHSCRQSCLSFREAFALAAEQTELSIMANSKDIDEYRGLCYIIAEMYMLDDSATVSIADEALPAAVVKDVFREIRFEHMELVVEKFRRLTFVVHSKRTYLRAMLYNSVFEYAADTVNEFAVKETKAGRR